MAKCVRQAGRGQGDLKAVANSRNLTVTGSNSAVPWESPVQGVTLCRLLQDTGRRQTCGFQTQSWTARCTANLGRRACLFKTFNHVQTPPPTSSWRKLKESEILAQRPLKNFENAGEEGGGNGEGPEAATGLSQ